MTDRTMELTRRKMLGGLAGIGAASATAGAGTFAYFSDTESSDGNTVTAGTLDLALDDSNVWSTAVTDLAPGETVSGSIELSNSGSLSGDHVEIAAAVPSENDDSTMAPNGNGADKSASAVAQNLHVEKLHYPDGDFFSAATQVPGAYVYDIDGSGSKNADVISTSDPASGGRSGVVHATSDGSTLDYTRSIVDVSDQQVTLDDLANGTTEYDFYPTGNNTVSTPDELKLLVRDGDGTHFIYQQVGPAGSDDQWNTRNVDAELNGDAQINGSSTDNANGWYEVALASGDQTDLGTSPTDEYGGATVLGIGFGAGNFSTSNDVTIDVYYDELTVAGQSYEFRSSPMSLADLSKTTLDNLAAPGSGSKTFAIEMRLNPQVGNAFQGDGVDVDFEFGLAQESGQSLL